MNDFESEWFKRWRQDTQGRFPDNYIENRIAREQRKDAALKAKQAKHPLKRIDLRFTANLTLKATGLFSFGRKNAANIAVTHRRLNIDDLPKALSGYRILHISDPHFNGDTVATRNIVNAISSVNYDLCVLTGDYRYRSFGEIETAMDGVSELKNSITSDIIAILGNHDSIVMAPRFEALGIDLLLNEHRQITVGNATLTVIGVDDPSYYKLDDLQRSCGDALEAKPACTLLLAHSPDLYENAARLGIKAYFCGHTHGGQICLPGGIPVVSNTRSPRWAVKGEWKFEGLDGYTSVGAGVSIVPVRFFCRPEITVHELISG